MTLRPDDLTPDIPDAERAQLAELATRLEAQRPYPSAAFRSRLGSHLRERTTARGWLGIEWFGAYRPAYGLAGSGLLLLAGLGPIGLGPFAG